MTQVEILYHCARPALLTSETPKQKKKMESFFAETNTTSIPRLKAYIFFRKSNYVKFD
jgi:hypothetical protein